MRGIAISIHVVGQPVGGRHRLGAPGLKYCRHLRPVRARLVTRPERRGRHVARVSRTRVGAALVLAVTVSSTVLVSGWYAAAGAAVIADLVPWVSLPRS